jgi:hypothetical protein
MIAARVAPSAYSACMEILILPRSIRLVHSLRKANSLLENVLGIFKESSKNLEFRDLSANSVYGNGISKNRILDRGGCFQTEIVNEAALEFK